MSLLTLGINHRSASVEVREQLSFSPSDIAPAAYSIRKQALATGVVIVSTCNRTELYLVGVDSPERVCEWLAESRQVPLEIVQESVYIHYNQYASQHLFRVAAGLDSLALGEPQILGQIKDAYQQAVELNTVDKTLNKLFQEAFYIARNVRTSTRLGENAISIVYAGIKLSEQFYSHYEKLTALVIGAGHTSQLAVKHLHKKGIGKILIANRTLSKAQKLALSVNGIAMTLEQVEYYAHEADIIVSATGRGVYTVSASDLAKAQKKRLNRMQLLLDFAIPRDIEPDIRKLQNCYLFGVDDLKAIVEQNQELRQQAAQQAEELINDYNRHFYEWLELRQHHHLIKGVHHFAQHEKDKLLMQAKKRLACGDSPEQVLDELATRLTKKLTHHPSMLIRQASEKGSREMLDTIKALYSLD